MKSINKNFILLVLFSYSAVPSQILAQNQLSSEFGPTWERAKAYTLEVAEAMPEEFYSYRPSEDVLTFGEHLIHIVENYYHLNGKYVLGLDEIDYDFAETDTLSKEQIVGRLQGAFQYVSETMTGLNDTQLNDTIKFWSPTPTLRKSIFYLMRDHMTHHRGMMVLYLRMKGIPPPRYRGW